MQIYFFSFVTHLTRILDLQKIVNIIIFMSHTFLLCYFIEIWNIEFINKNIILSSWY
jgi:hypothetical protein